MVKTASTSTIIKALQAFEAQYGIGSVRSIGAYCSGDRSVEYAFHIVDSEGKEHTVEVYTEDEQKIWEVKIYAGKNLG